MSEGCLCRLGNAVQNPFKIHQHLVIPETEDPIPLLSYRMRSTCIRVCLQRMLSAIQLDSRCEFQATDNDEV